jgi:hypothetical protein
MALTRDFKLTILERVERDPDFATTLLDEAATSFLSGSLRLRASSCGIWSMPQSALNSSPRLSTDPARACIECSRLKGTPAGTILRRSFARFVTNFTSTCRFIALKLAEGETLNSRLDRRESAATNGLWRYRRKVDLRVEQPEASLRPERARVTTYWVDAAKCGTREGFRLFRL